MIQDLEKAFKLFYDLHLDWKNSEKEERYIEYIHKMAESSEDLSKILTFIEHENREIRIQAFLILLESRDKKIIEKLIYAILKNENEISDFMAFLGYINDESFSIFFYILKNIGFDKTPQNTTMTIALLTYIAMNMQEKYIHEFFNYKKYNLQLQSHIILKLRYFSKAQNIILQAYKENHPVFYTKDNKKDDGCIGFTFLLQKNEDIAFTHLRNSESLLDINQHGLFYLNKFGDKTDGKLILNILQKEISDNKINDRLLYELLENIMSTTNPILFSGLVSYLKYDNYPLKKRLHYFFTLQYQKFVGKKQSSEIQILLADIANNQKEISSLNAKEKESISSTHLFNFWNDIIQNVSDYEDAGHKISFSSTKKNSIYTNLLPHPYNGYIIEPLPEHSSLIIYTGEYLPYDNTGFYSKFKSHLELWNTIVSKDTNNFLDGRWIRYGRYMD